MTQTQLDDMEALYGRIEFWEEKKADAENMIRDLDDRLTTLQDSCDHRDTKGKLSMNAKGRCKACMRIVSICETCEHLDNGSCLKIEAQVDNDYTCMEWEKIKPLEAYIT